jgi:hypothetical protein
VWYTTERRYIELYEEKKFNTYSVYILLENIQLIKQFTLGGMEVSSMFQCGPLYVFSNTVDFS